MIRYIWLFDLNGDEAARHRSEAWYEQVHAPEVRAARGEWLSGYRSWYSLDNRGEGLRPYDYRATEMDFDDLGPQPIGSQYTQYPEQANDLGVTEEFYSRTESFRHSHRKPPTAILVEGDIAPPAGGVRELLFIALADESAEELERLERLLLARPSALCVRVHRALHAEEETLAAASLFPSPWSVLVESDFSSASAWRSALLDDAGRAWRETLESGSVGLLASSLIAAAPDHDYLEVA